MSFRRDVLTGTFSQRHKQIIVRFLMDDSVPLLVTKIYLRKGSEQNRQEQRMPEVLEMQSSIGKE